MKRGRRPIADRQFAIEMGARTYAGATHTCGTTERYTSNCACVRCSRAVQTEQREARKLLMSKKIALDNAPDVGQEEIDEREQALNDIM